MTLSIAIREWVVAEEIHYMAYWQFCNESIERSFVRTVSPTVQFVEQNSEEKCCENVLTFPPCPAVGKSYSRRKAIIRDIFSSLIVQLIIQSLSEQFDIEVLEVSKILFRHALRVL